MTNDEETPEVATDDFSAAVPNGVPELRRPWTGRGRRPVLSPKVLISFRLAADVVQHVRHTGKGYNARVEKVLRDAIAKGLL